MKIQKELLLKISVVGLLLLISASVVGVITKMRIDATRKQIDATRKQQDEQSVTTTLPPIISQVRNLEVVSASIESVDGAGREAVIVVKNNTDKGIEALAIKSGTYMVTEDNGLSTDNPDTIIEPFATHRIEIPVENLSTKDPIIIAGVFYKDKTEDGQTDVLKKMHGNRDREKAKRVEKSNKGQ